MQSHIPRRSEHQPLPPRHNDHLPQRRPPAGVFFTVDEITDDGPMSGSSMLDRLALSSNEEALFGTEADDFSAALSDIRERFSIAEDAEVIHSGSGYHVGAAFVFGAEHVVHVEPDVDATTALDKHGYRTATTTIEEYLPEHPADVLVALNSYGEPTTEALADQLKPGALIIANNWTKWANQLNNLGNTTELEGAILPAYNSAEARYVDATDMTDDDPTGIELFHDKQSGVDFEMAKNADALFVFRYRGLAT